MNFNVCNDIINRWMEWMSNRRRLNDNSDDLDEHIILIICIDDINHVMMWLVEAGRHLRTNNVLFCQPAIVSTLAHLWCFLSIRWLSSVRWNTQVNSSLTIRYQKPPLRPWRPREVRNSAWRIAIWVLEAKAEHLRLLLRLRRHLIEQESHGSDSYVQFLDETSRDS